MDIDDTLAEEGSMVAALYAAEELAEWGTEKAVATLEGVVAEVLGSLLEEQPCLVSEAVTSLVVAQRILFD